ncbi:unnamed protein product, partial [Mesorhabditis spiculigera]
MWPISSIATRAYAARNFWGGQLEDRGDMASHVLKMAENEDGAANFALLSLVSTEYTGRCNSNEDCWPNNQQTCSDFGFCQGPSTAFACPNGKDSDCEIQGMKCFNTSCAWPTAN